MYQGTETMQARNKIDYACWSKMWYPWLAWLVWYPMFCAFIGNVEINGCWMFLFIQNAQIPQVISYNKKTPKHSHLWESPIYTFNILFQIVDLSDGVILSILDLILVLCLLDCGAKCTCIDWSWMGSPIYFQCHFFLMHQMLLIKDNY